jgi:hypothetical protein
VPLSAQIVWLFILALPIACVSWTITHEEAFREPREYFMRKSQESGSLATRKFFYLLTCEYCFSHYVAALFLIITRYTLLYADWRGYLVSLFALVWVANQYMTVYANIRTDLKVERYNAKKIEKEVEQKERELEEPAPVIERPAA